MPARLSRHRSRSLLLTSALATHNADQAAVIRHLLSNSNSVHDTDINGNTCLHLVLAAALPEQPWTVHTLSELIQAGANPTQINHIGLNAFDIACQAPAQFGSFRQDILLQALIECGSDILDDRLLNPLEVTSCYTPLHHALICGDQQAGADFHFRQGLVNRLAFETHRPSIGPRSELYDSSVDRILGSSPQWHSSDVESTFSRAKLYMQRIIAARRQLKCMIEERVSYETWTELSRFVDVRQAQNSALLEFDWFLPVDGEDVFVSQIDSLIQRLEDVVPHSTVDRLIFMLEASVPKSQQSNAEHTQALSGSESPAFLPRIVISPGQQELSRSSENELEASNPRKESMVKTPVHFHKSDADRNLAELPQLAITCIDCNDDSDSDEPTEGLRKKSMVQTPIHFYLCQLQTEDALSFARPRRS